MANTVGVTQGRDVGEIPLLLAGLVLLILGAELLVRASVSIATRLGVSALVVGLTVVAFGTSAPEAVVSITASLQQSTGIAIGNIVGSNITNGLLVAGIVAIVAPIQVANAALARDGLVSLLAAGGFWLICALQVLNIGTGSALLVGLVLYVLHSYRAERFKAGPACGAVRSKGLARGQAQASVKPGGSYTHALSVLGIVTGIALLVLGGDLLIDAAASLAARIGVSETVIGLTVVAIGTSLPELATSLLAALRGKPDIAIGNVVGSNVFNVLGVGGVTAILSQNPVPSRIVTVDFPVMLASISLLLLFAATNRRIGRVEGGLLIGAFVLYLSSAWLFGT